MMSKHAIRFSNLVQDARFRIKEVPLAEVLARHGKGELINLIDVREDREWLHSHIPGARHLSKGTIERDVEIYYRKVEVELILYCEDGSRSALAADSLHRMGYEGACSMTGGFKAWKAAGGPLGL
jgi:rhodanese-related sulfurtransferase